jgi:hypothetical protein
VGVLKVSVVGRGPLTSKLYSRRASKAVVANGSELVGAMRRGPGSVDSQFQKQGTLGRNFAFTPWPKTKPFGPKAKFQARTLKRTGRYLAAWRGEGSGSVQRITPRTVEIGVDSTQFPQTQVFQKRTPTGIKVTRKMRFFLGLVKGVWLKKSTQLIIVEPRAFRVNPAMILSMRRVIVDYIINGRSSVRTAGGRR